ncbi:transport protein [Klebsiella pneumoniae]|nr:transport protein [Klebsiella pneumoniae]
MFKSFFPKPGPFFISAFIWSMLAVIFWQAGGGDWLLRVTGASQNVAISAARFWSLNYLVFYAYYLFCVGVFALFWFVYCPHRWQYWSILGPRSSSSSPGFWWKSGWRSTPGMRRSTT